MAESRLISGIHHVEIFTKSLKSALKVFVGKWGLCPSAVHKEGPLHGTLVSNGNVRFLLRQETADSTTHEVDSVVDVAFESPNLQNLLGCIRNNSDIAFSGSVYHSDAYSSCKLSSCIPNLSHTVLERRNKYILLPNFDSIAEPDKFLAACDLEFLPNTVPDFSQAYIDHVAVACKPHESSLIMNWYRSLFGFRRFVVNKTESEDGFLVRYKDSGMNLKAMNSSDQHQEQEQDVKLVFAESLNTGSNQINTFLKEHGNTGVQHIAVNAGHQFINCVKLLRQRGVQFMDPPITYYNEVGKFKEIADLGIDPISILENQILVDTESSLSMSSNGTENKNYLMQVFSKPLLTEETFFLELISRRGARGFGAGNISALWRAVELYMRQVTVDKQSGTHVHR